MKKRHFLRLSSAATASLAFGVTSPPQANAQSTAGTLRVAMTAGDIPLTTGQPSQGAEGVRFMGITVYDGLTRWDLSRSDVAAKIVPDLAESWSISEAEKKVWTFKLRRGVRFHDGSEFNADAVVWNLDKLVNRNAPQFDAAQAAQGGLYTGGIASWRKLDDNTVEITTKVVDAVLPYSLASVFMSSPAQYEKVGRDWKKFAEQPSGTGPWKLESFKPRERADLVRNPDHWDKARVPKCERLVLPYMLSFEEGSPFRDLRVRKAANMAIDRKGLVTLLGGLAAPARGMVDPDHPWFGNPKTDLSYNPNAAKQLLAEAGYGDKNPVKVKFAISTSGSGQMQPLPMNEFIKENMHDVGIDVEFEVIDWEALRNRRRLGAAAPENRGSHGLNSSWAYWDPDIGLIGPASMFMKASGFNWGNYSNPKAEELAKAAKEEFDLQKQAKLLAQLHEVIVDDAIWVWAVHDLNPRALAPSVKGFVQAQSWLQDLTTVTVG